MNLHNVVAGLAFAASVAGPGAAGASTVDLFGDIDCFGTGLACTEGPLTPADSTTFFDFVNAFVPDPTTPVTDQFFVLESTESWTHDISIAGATGDGTLSFRTFGLADIAAYDVLVNGHVVGGIADIPSDANFFSDDHIVTHTFSVALGFLFEGLNTITLSTPGTGDSWALDYSRLSVPTDAVVPLPASLPLALAGLAALGLARSRRKN